MNALLMAISVGGAIFGNSFKNIFSKKLLKNQSDNLVFNLIGNGLVMLILALAGGAAKVSGQTALYALGMGITSLLAGVLFSLCLTGGPMALTTLIQLGISLVFSALLGPVFWNEKITLLQVAGIVLILISMVLTSNAKIEKNITFKWLALTVICGIFNGTIGLFQKLQTASSRSEEQMGFLFFAFVVCTLSNCLWLTFSRKKVPVTFALKGMGLVSALICGTTTALQHIINLKLVGVLPTVIFFPVCTGSRILLTALVGILLFKEKLSRRQLAGFIIGFGAMFLVTGILG